jgi:hypothetical protein
MGRRSPLETRHATEMYTFNTTIHCRPPEATPSPAIELTGRSFAALAIPREALSHPFNLTFEAAVERLNQLERMFSEPDGSFVWVSPHDSLPWQVDGNLFDRNGRLLFVDLKGTCPPEEFDRLLAAFGWPETPLVFQLVREAIFLDEPEFRRWAIGEA